MGLKRQLREESACRTGMILRSHEKKPDAWKYTGLVKGQLWVSGLQKEFQATKERWQHETKSSPGKNPPIVYPVSNGQLWKYASK